MGSVQWTEDECRAYVRDVGRMAGQYHVPWARMVARQMGDAPRPRVVDLACGPGLVGMELARLRPDIRLTLADRSPAMISFARKEAEGRGLDVQTSCSPAEALQLDAECADVVIIKHLLLHAEDLDVVFAEASRILVPGGRLFVIDMDPDRPPPMAWLIWLGARIRLGSYRAGRFWWGYTHAHPLPLLRSRLERAGFAVQRVLHRNVNYVVCAGK